MKKLILSLTVILALDLQAQFESIMPDGANYTYDDIEEINWANILAGDKKIKSVQRRSAGKKKDVFILAMNKSGQIIEKKTSSIWRTGPFWIFKKRIHRHQKFVYSGNMISEVQFFDKKGQMTGKYVYEYFAPAKIKHAETWKKGKKVFESNAKFNADSNVFEYSTFKINDGKSKLTLRYEYDYYPDKQRKETRMFSGNNRLKHIWKYECNPKGQILNKKETQVCKNSGVDNKGRLISTVFRTNARGQKTKEVHTYYIFNGKEVELQLELYLIGKRGERKLYEFHFADSVEKFNSYKYFDSKGRISSERRTDYSVYTATKKRMSSRYFHFYSKNKLTLRGEEAFNAEGLEISMVNYGRKNRVISKAEYEYTGDSKYIVKQYKKDRLMETLTGEIEYY